jgi:short-subunit dehydrogenase
LQDTNITVTVLLPGASDTDFFHKAHAENTVTYREQKLASAEEVAKDGYEAMMSGESSVISGAKTKLNVLKSKLMSDESNAASSRAMKLSQKAAHVPITVLRAQNVNILIRQPVAKAETIQRLRILQLTIVNS